MTHPQGLLDLNTDTLSAEDRQRHAEACAPMLGPAPWKARKASEMHDLLALAARSPRLTVVSLDARVELRVVLDMRVPVPCRPDPDGPLVVAQRALLGVRYGQQSLIAPSRGTDFVSVLAPAAVYAPNIASGDDQRVCLGASLPAGMPLREIVLATYAALSMTTVQMDPQDEAGVLNLGAALWWQQNADRMPLTRATLLSALETADAGRGAASAEGMGAPAGDAGAGRPS